MERKKAEIGAGTGENAENEKDKLPKMLLHFMEGNTKRYILSVLLVSFLPRMPQCPGKCDSRPPGKQPERQLFRHTDTDIRKENDLIFHLTAKQIE